ncbi:PepSY-associated TM helix domain-containing protein [Virgisporangium aurantiacum]|uniref:Membrane protein n=1 Tax=Virgisporangium aurantiacum TaxID=175570 RepID=A0A8J3Z7J7_9ACTN|nr:PepSY domain-containing protein [Virgisporangium aurantiacum]GIJ56775.1 membrane protein [Virgisporangium aurantiacum]
MAAPETTAVADGPPDSRADAGSRLGDGVTAPSRSIAPLLLRLHFYAGILIAPFLVVAAVTGLAFTLTPTLDRLVYADEFFTDGSGQRRPLAEQVAAASAARPDGTVAAVILPDGNDANTRVVFNVEGLGENQITVYVDPYTARVTGSLETWFGETPLQTWFDDLHRNLHLGDVGRHYSELAASWLWVVALGGLVLWLRRQRGRRKKVRGTLLPDLAARKGVRRTRGWHAATGVWLTVGLLILAATGLTWSRYAGGNFGAVLDHFDKGRPAVSTDATAAGGGGHHDAAGGAATEVDLSVLDTVVGTARAAGLDGHIEISVPAAPGGAWTVIQDDMLWPVHYDSVAVDAGGTTVTDRVNYSEWPVLAKLSKLGVLAHMGLLFGIANQIVLAAFAIGLLCVIFWGYRMWWQRRPTRADRARPFGVAPARAAWQQLPSWAIVVGVPAVLAIGYAMPVLGVSLVVFLAIDLAVGTARKRRVGRIAPVSPAVDSHAYTRAPST